jgi:hypothetical protein
VRWSWARCAGRAAAFVLEGCRDRLIGGPSRLV